MSHDILVLYYSRYGATAKLAEAVAMGVTLAGGTPRLRTVPPVAPETIKTLPPVPEEGAVYVKGQDLLECAGIALGSPTRFGNMAAPLKYFLDTTGAQWASGALIDKPAGVFTSTGSMHGGQETTLLSMALPLIHHGAIWVGLPYSEADLMETSTGGTPYGPSHLSGPKSDLPLTDVEARLAQALGKRLATLAQKLS